jgi:hypothetical protein
MTYLHTKAYFCSEIIRFCSRVNILFEKRTSLLRFRYIHVIVFFSFSMAKLFIIKRLTALCLQNIYVCLKQAGVLNVLVGHRWHSQL